MKKAVSKCMQEDAPELDLPPFRYMNRFTNSLVSMANSRSQDQDLYKMMKFMMMMKMMQQGGSNNQDHHNFRSGSEDTKYRRHDNHDSNYRSYDDMSPMMRRFMSKRQADDSLQLNDRLKEKLEHVMEEHVSEMSNMTCVLREMNVLNSRNNIDIAAMKADTENYNMPSGSSRSTSPSWTTATRSPRTSPPSSTTCSTSTETTSSATWARSRASSPAAREPR